MVELAHLSLCNHGPLLCQLTQGCFRLEHPFFLKSAKWCQVMTGRGAYMA